MGSSLILQGGAATAKTLKETITQAAHGFTVGDVIRWDSTAATPKYVLAQADSAANAEVAGVVSLKSDANTFDITYNGYIDLSQFSGITAPVLFLSSTVPGGLTLSPPSAVGTVVKPVLTRNTSGSGHLVMNYLGTQIGGSSTIAVDEIQPVGTIMPFAGTAIPDTWLECNGTTYTVADYPELYSKIIYTTGDRAPIYGHVVELDLDASFTGTGSAYAYSAVGDYIFIKNHTTTATATAPGATPFIANAEGEGSWDTMGVIVAKGANSSGVTGFKVQIYPRWTATGQSGTRRFVMPNVLVKSAVSSTISSAYRIIQHTSNTSAPVDNGRIATARVIAFTVPDLSGRTPIGVMDTGSDVAGFEDDSPYVYITGQQGPIVLGAMGGEDRHILTTAEMPSHSHIQHFNTTPTLAAGAQGQQDLSPGTNATAGAATATTGDNAPHNNMPPYLAVRYIIKAKPYTRAAIIDGIDLPYNSLLVRDLRSRNVGGSNGDLVFYTNTSGDSGNGTERMRLTTDGKFGIGTSSPANGLLQVTTSSGQQGQIAFSSTDYGGLTVLGHDMNGDSFFYETVTGKNIRLGTSNTERVRITTDGNVIVGPVVAAAGATLDVNGTLKVGDFGGTTNVMVKPARVSGGGVGHVVPLFTWSSAFNSTSYDVMNHTTPLHAGTWLVYFAGHTDNGLESENFSCVMNHVWTVPASKWLTFATSTAFTGTGTSQVPSATSNDDSRVWYKLHDSLGTLRTASIAHGTITAANGWTALNSNNAYTLGTQDATDITKIGFVYSNKWYGPVNLIGYAIRIA